MEALKSEGFVLDDNLRLKPFAGFFRLYGEISCQGGIVIRVQKTFDAVQTDPVLMIQTIQYSYTARVPEHGRIYQSDNAHAHHGHADPHHRHNVDWRNDAELAGSPEWVGRDRWPTLSEFIRFTEDWYRANDKALPPLPPYTLPAEPSWR